jgi:hypothetical protein
MHSGSARFRVRSQYCSAGFFFPFVVPMMDTICVQLLGLGFDLSTTCVVVSIILKTGPVIEPVRPSIQVFTGRTVSSPVQCPVF